MDKVKRNTAKFMLGINDVNSGSLLFLKFSRNGRINLADQSPAVKRPNQYQIRMK